MKQYKVIEGRFSLRGDTYEYGQVLDLNESDIKRLEESKIIGTVLEKYDKTVEASDDSDLPNGNLEDMTKAQLKEMADKLGINVSGMNKTEMISALSEDESEDESEEDDSDLPNN